MALRTERPSLDDLEPEGYIELHCADTGIIMLRADQRGRVRAWRMEQPPGWVSAVDRYGDEIDLWWPSIRQVVYTTRAGMRRSHDLSMASDDAGADHPWE